jgi:hypothetical protein
MIISNSMNLVLLAIAKKQQQQEPEYLLKFVVPVEYSIFQTKGVTKM